MGFYAVAAHDVVERSRGLCGGGRGAAQWADRGGRRGPRRQSGIAGRRGRLAAASAQRAVDSGRGGPDRRGVESGAPAAGRDWPIWCRSMHAELARLEQQAEFIRAQRGGVASDQLFAVQGWLPAEQAAVLARGPGPDEPARGRALDGAGRRRAAANPDSQSGLGTARSKGCSGSWEPWRATASSTSPCRS